MWRIHDKLYDLSKFANNHPGGKFWIAGTKGTDITEAFETHHLMGKAEKLLPKYFVKEAKEPRNITLTLNDDGFYKVLKKRVVEKLNEIDQEPARTTDVSMIFGFSFYVGLVGVPWCFENEVYRHGNLESGDESG